MKTNQERNVNGGGARNAVVGSEGPGRPKGEEALLWIYKNYICEFFFLRRKLEKEKYMKNSEEGRPLVWARPRMSGDRRRPQGVPRTHMAEVALKPPFPFFFFFR